MAAVDTENGKSGLVEARFGGPILLLGFASLPLLVFGRLELWNLERLLLRYLSHVDGYITRCSFLWGASCASQKTPLDAVPSRWVYS